VDMSNAKFGVGDYKNVPYIDKFSPELKDSQYLLERSPVLHIGHPVLQNVKFLIFFLF
jgi:hypothetical protein